MATYQRKTPAGSGRGAPKKDKKYLELARKIGALKHAVTHLNKRV
jgi:hypothetical protein